MQLDLSLRWRFNQTITKVTVYRPERHTAVACRGSWSSSWWISKSMLDHCPVVYSNLISVSLSWLNASFLHAKFAKSQWNLFLPAYKDAANDKISSVHQHSETVQPPQSVKASSSCSAVMWVFCFLLSICANLWRCQDKFWKRTCPDFTDTLYFEFLKIFQKVETVLWHFTYSSMCTTVVIPTQLMQHFC